MIRNSACWVIFHDFWLSAAFFTIYFFKKFSEMLSVPNSLDPDQDCFSVGPELGSKCLLRLSADNKNRF